MTPSTSPSRVTLHGIGRPMLIGIVTIVPPLLVGVALLGPDATTMLVFGSLVGFMNTAVGGRRLGSMASALFLLMAPVALVAGQNALAGTCLIVVACLAIGTGAYWKRYASLHVGLVGLVFLVLSPAVTVTALIDGPRATRYLLEVLVGTAVCAYWPVVVMPLLHAVREIPVQSHFDEAATLRYVLVSTVLVSAATFYAAAFARDSHGVWLPLTLLMVLQVVPDATHTRALQRVWGTIGGALFAAITATVFHDTWVVAVIGVFALLALFATAGREPYGVFAFFVTTVVLLGVSAGEPALEASLLRVVYTAVGAGIALAANAVLLRRGGMEQEQSRPAT